MALAIASQLGRGRAKAQSTDAQAEALGLLDEACRARVVIPCNDVGLTDSAPEIRDYATAVQALGGRVQSRPFIQLHHARSPEREDAL
jgi:hypothetical protein